MSPSSNDTDEDVIDELAEVKADSEFFRSMCLLLSVDMARAVARIAELTVMVFELEEALEEQRQTK